MPGLHEWIDMDEEQLRIRRGRSATRITEHLRGVYLTHLSRDHATKMTASEPLRHLRARHADVHERCDCTEEVE